MMMGCGIHLYMALDVSISDRVFLAFPKIPLSFLCDQKIASPSYHIHSVPIPQIPDLAIARLLDRSFTSLFEDVFPVDLLQSLRLRYDNPPSASFRQTQIRFHLVLGR
jgi:hypothetical protein